MKIATKTLKAHLGDDYKSYTPFVGYPENGVSYFNPNTDKFVALSAAAPDSPIISVASNTLRYGYKIKEKNDWSMIFKLLYGLAPGLGKVKTVDLLRKIISLKLYQLGINEYEYALMPTVNEVFIKFTHPGDYAMTKFYFSENLE